MSALTTGKRINCARYDRWLRRIWHEESRELTADPNCTIPH